MSQPNVIPVFLSLPEIFLIESRYSVESCSWSHVQETPAPIMSNISAEISAKLYENGHHPLSVEPYFSWDFNDVTKNFRQKMSGYTTEERGSRNSVEYRLFFKVCSNLQSKPQISVPFPQTTEVPLLTFSYWRSPSNHIRHHTTSMAY